MSVKIRILSPLFSGQLFLASDATDGGTTTASASVDVFLPTSEWSQIHGIILAAAAISNQTHSNSTRQQEEAECCNDQAVSCSSASLLCSIGVVDSGSVLDLMLVEHGISQRLCVSTLHCHPPQQQQGIQNHSQVESQRRQWSQQQQLPFSRW